jgi:hypothetical protein
MGLLHQTVAFPCGADIGFDHMGLAAPAADVAGHLFGLFDIGKAMQGDFDPLCGKSTG